MKAVIVVALTLATCGTARARSESPKIDLTLLAPPGDLPDYLCVVSTQEVPKQGKRLLGQPQAPLAILSAHFEENSKTHGYRVAGAKLPLPIPDTAIDRRDALIASGEYLDPVTSRALRHLQPRCAAGDETCECESPHGGCVPEISVRSELTASKPAAAKFGGYLRCAYSDAPNFQDQVLVVFLDFRADLSPAILDIKLAGNLATVSLSQAYDESKLPYGFVLGGHYDPAATAGAPGLQRRIVLPLQLRCPTFVGRLPPHTGLTLTAMTFGKQVCRPVAKDGRFVKVRMPFSSFASDANVSLVARDGATSVRLVATTPSTSEQRTFDFAFRELTLKWQTHCLYPRADRFLAPVMAGARCPSVHVNSNGTSCDVLSDSAGVCSYACRVGPTENPIALPTRVHFERIVDRIEESGSKREWKPVVTDAWDDELSSSGQTLTSFVAPGDRRIEVRLDPNDWSWRKGDEIDEVRVQGPDGSTHIVQLPSRNRRHSVAVPGVTCGDSVLTTVSGARRYYPTRLAIHDGVIELGARSKRIREWGAGWFLGAGIEIPDPDPFADHQLRPEGVVAAGFYAWYAFARRWALEPDFVLSGTRKAVATSDFVREGEPARLDHMNYYRWTASASVVWARNRNFKLGVGLGGGVGASILDDDARKREGADWSTFLQVLGRHRTFLWDRGWVEGVLGLRIFEGNVYKGEPAGFFQLRFRMGP